MDAFSPNPPPWTDNAIHVLSFCCPSCGACAREQEEVWINRRAPVINLEGTRRWQEFYRCACSRAWWAWSSDRPPNDLGKAPKPDNS